MPPICQYSIEHLIREAEEDTKYLCEVVLPTMEEQGKLWPFNVSSYIERFSPIIALACPLVSRCERGRASRENIFQFYLNLNGRHPIRVKEIHYHDDDLHSRNYNTEMEICLQMAAIGLPYEIIGVREGKRTNLESQLF